MRARILTTALAATLAVAGLTSCRTNVGLAARVDSHKITESDVNTFITPTGISSSAAASGQISPRSQVLTLLVQEQVFEQTLASVNQHPSAGQLAAAHDGAAGLLLQTQLTGDALDKELRKQLPVSGIRPSFTATFLRVQELEYTIINTQKLKQLSELLALIKKAKVSVSVNARYGTWDPAKLSLDGKPVVPSFLTQQPLPAAGGATAAPTAG